MNVKHKQGFMTGGGAVKQTVFRRVRRELKNLIYRAWESAFQEGLLPEPGDREGILLEVPKERKHGSFASNIALQLAKSARRPPRETAEILRRYIPAHPYVAGVKTAGPGFLNFHLTPIWLKKTLLVLAEDPERFGMVEDLQGEKIQVEFISANPVGPMNVVNARAGALGDTLAGLFRFCGAEAEKEYYVNDYGMQVGILGRSLAARCLELAGEKVSFPDNGYQGEYLVDLAKELYEEKGPALLEMTEEERVAYCREWGCRRILAGQRKDLEDYGLVYDRWFSERTLHESGAVDAV